MKKTHGFGIMRLCAAFLCLVLLLQVSVQPQADTFNRTAAKKKVTVTYRKLPDGVLAICKNKNGTALELSMTMRFRDGDKKDISRETQRNLCMTAKSTAAFFFPAPRDSYGNVVNYSSYKGSYTVAKSRYKSSAKKIAVSSEIDTIESRFAAVNGGGRKLTNIHATIVFYDGNDNILGCSSKYLNCFDKGAIDQFKIGYADKPWQPSRIKVYIDWAY